MTTLVAFLFVLGVLIFVHELGHFLAAEIGFPDIPRVIERVLGAADRADEPGSLDDILAIDAWARTSSRETIRTLRSSQ